MKIGLIYSFEKSAWKSCQVISANLLKTYQSISKNIVIVKFNYDDSMSEYDKLKLAEEIVKSQLTHLSIIDHKPHPVKLLKFLDYYFSENKKISRPLLLIHVFGDFTLYSKEWLESEKYMKSFLVKFICASDRQKSLVSKFLKNKSNSTYKCPFPVDSGTFNFSNTLRDRARNELEITDSTTVFLYTGRLSLQKKIIEITLDFAQFIRATDADAILVLAGDFDDIGNPFTGIHSKSGEYSQTFYRVMQKLEPGIQSKIKYVGNLSQPELSYFYNSADCFVSLSTHNDEDFGMSPAEALCTGLPALLSDWAGYASFNLNEQNNCTLIPVSIGDQSILYQRGLLIKNFIKTTSQINSLRSKRSKLARINTQAFSIVGNIDTLKNILNDKPQPFKGFSKTMNNFSFAFSRNQPPFIQYEISYTDLYKEVYESYLRN